MPLDILFKSGLGEKGNDAIIHIQLSRFYKQFSHQYFTELRMDKLTMQSVAVVARTSLDVLMLHLDVQSTTERAY